MYVCLDFNNKGVINKWLQHVGPHREIRPIPLRWRFCDKVNSRPLQCVGDDPSEFDFVWSVPPSIQSFDQDVYLWAEGRVPDFIGDLLNPRTHWEQRGTVLGRS